MKTFYVTTPIYYANDVPHVGHAYTTLAADVLARYWKKKLGAENVFFLTGTDEHGQKIAQAAQKAGLEPKAFVDSLVPRFEQAWEALGIEPNLFMRTTKREHTAFAQKFFTKLRDNDDLYLDEYEGVYCVGCEAYKTETELIDGKCSLHPTLEPEHRKEQNYFFKLTKYAPKILAALEAGTLKVEPESRRNEISSRLRGDIRDISVSRPGIDWGIPVPWDQSQTIYVWVEALLNYLSALEINHTPSLWPAQVQLMAKDIVWFHASIWPALLLAGGYDLPEVIFAHGFFTVDGQKMSKTLGNVIDPVQLALEWGTDATRYFLLSAVPFGADGDIQPSRFASRYNADLANDLGNLLQRVVTLIKRANLKIKPGAAPACADTDQAIEALRLDEGLKAIWTIVHDANQRLEDAKPWEVLTNHQSPITNHQFVRTLTTAYRQLETIAKSLAPYLPETSQHIFEQLRSSRPAPLFPRYDDQ